MVLWGLNAAVLEPSDIDLVGSQAFLLPGGLALGNLARASQASVVRAVRAEDAAGHALAGIGVIRPGQ